MKRPYEAPSFAAYGDIASITGIFGGPSAGDVLVDEDGNVQAEGKQSIDACAEQGGKCICEDNGSC